MNKFYRLAVGLSCLLLSISAFASAVIETATGSIRVGKTAAATAAASKGHRVQAGNMVVTGPKSLATLRFDDGQYIILHENSEFRVAEYAFSKEAPAKDRFSFELLKGALRSVSAALTNRNLKAYQLRIPQGTVGIRGTDYMVALVNPAYFSVTTGAINVANAGGVATFGAGTTGFVANATALATTIPASTLPASVSATFSQLSAVTVSVAGAGAAAQAAAGGLTPGAVGIGAAVAAGAAAALSGDDNPAAATATTTTGTR